MHNPITKQKIEQLIQERVQIKMIDIRPHEEYEKLHIPGVINIPSEILTDEIAQFSKEETLICICNHGKERSQKAAEALYNLGFTHSFYLEEGTSGWIK